MTKTRNDSLSDSLRRKLLQGEAHVEVSFGEDDFIHAEGGIFVESSPEAVWKILTDYDNLARTIPKVAESRLVEERGSEKIIDQTGRSSILFFEASVHILLRVRERFPESLDFEQIEGDFRVYRGAWRFEPEADGRGVFVLWRAHLKTGFFVPSFLVSFVQRQDLPTVLLEIKRLAETGDAPKQT